ncbi:MAG: thiamine pyrophosphate-dependent dehydrogenase E1 component subunit alpha [Candidatus Atribacteria bacterium]|nr:thiamine pyrophosphate-dependent dehydrogenase E1 component subunit alpha [Candidatus Atribacteria bacterium]
MEQKERILKMYEMMYLIRKYEERVNSLFLQGILPGTIHQSLGQEACAVGMLFDLEANDYVVSTHRPAGHALAKGVPLRSMMAEMFGKSTGCCRGKGGSMHVGDIRVGMPPAIAIVGGGLPIAVGLGLACKMKGTDRVVICFFGDGASNEGAFHEALNGAAIWNLPVIFACENNLYAASTRVDKVMKIEHIAERASAYGIPSRIVDGMDVLKVNEEARMAIERARNGKGPTLLELKTYRFCGHSRTDSCRYRDKKEEEHWRSRDPIHNLRSHILQEHIADEESLQVLENQVLEDIEESVQYALSSPDPEPEEALKHVFYGE